jgi:hypothetical protein
MRRSLNSAMAAALVAVAILACACQAPSAAPGGTPAPDIRPVLPELAACGTATCWQGITLDALRPAHVQAQAVRIPGFATIDFKPYWSKDDMSASAWFTPEIYPHILVAYRGGKAVALEQSTGDFALTRIVERFGQPSGVVVHYLLASKGYQVTVTVVYAAQGLLFQSEPATAHWAEQYELSPGLRMKTFILGPPAGEAGLFDAMLLANIKPPNERAAGLRQLFVDHTQAWHGFGTYRADLLQFK